VSDPVPGPVPAAIPDVVIDRLKRYLTADPVEALNRPAPAWNGKSAVQSVADGDRNWEDVLTHFDDMFRWEHRG
jgi:hypothetical protein